MNPFVRVARLGGQCVAIALVVTSADACSSDSHPSAPPCGPVPVNECPDAGAPSFQNQVFPILDAKCNNCHAHDKKLWPLTDYTHVSEWQTRIAGTVGDCTMPPPNGPLPLTAEERRQILVWTICGGPKN